MNIGDLFFKARLDGSGLEASAKAVGGKAGAAMGASASSKFGTALKQGASIGLGIGAFNLLGTAITKVTSFLGDAADAFREDQVSSQKLTTALRANVDGWDGNTRAIDARIAAGQRLGFSDEAQRSAIAELVAAYGDEEKALATLSIAYDLARFSGVDLATASDVLIKVHAGNFRALKALGIQTKDITTETQALAAIQKLAAGQAEDYAETLTGKLEVAEERAAEASEKFGQSVARLQAVTIPLAADALEDLANQFDALQNAGDESIPVMDRADALVQSIADSILSDFNPAMAGMVDLWNKGRDAAEVFDGAAFRAGEKVDLFADAASDAEGPTETLTDGLKDAEKAAEDLDRAIDDLARTISEELFGKAINEGNLADLQLTHKELVKQREEVKRGSQQWKVLTGEIAENEQAQFELQLQMKEKEGSQAVIAWLRQQIAKFGDANGQIQALIDHYKKLEKVATSAFAVVNSSGSPDDRDSPKPKGKARGGPVEPWQTYTVGEHGPEKLVMGEDRGFIVPNSGLAFRGGMPSGTPTGVIGGGSVTNVNVQVPGLLRAETPGDVVRTLRHLNVYGTFGEERK